MFFISNAVELIQRKQRKFHGSNTCFRKVNSVVRVSVASSPCVPFSPFFFPKYHDILTAKNLIDSIPSRQEKKSCAFVFL